MFVFFFNRACSCDAADNVSRVDAGTFTKKDHLPILEMLFDHPGTPNPSGLLTIGPLMCGPEKFGRKFLILPLLQMSQC